MTTQPASPRPRRRRLTAGDRRQIGKETNRRLAALCRRPGDGDALALAVAVHDVIDQGRAALTHIEAEAAAAISLAGDRARARLAALHGAARLPAPSRVRAEWRQPVDALRGVRQSAENLVAWHARGTDPERLRALAVISFMAVMHFVPGYVAWAEKVGLPEVGVKIAALKTIACVADLAKRAQAK